MNFNENKIYSASDYINAYAQLKRKGLPYGYVTGLINLDEVCRLDKGRLAVVTGVPSAGKSTFVNYLCAVYNIRYGFKTLFYSAETNLMLHLNTFYKIFQKQGDEKFAQYIAENFMLFNETLSFNTDALLEASENQYANIPFDVLVVDNYTKLSYSRPSNMLETEYISCVLDKLTIFAHRYNVMVILVVHPRKMNKGIEGGYEEPTPYDICSSSNFYNKADFCLTVHRVWEDGKQTDVAKITAYKVKTRNYGTTGSAYLGYSENYASYCDVKYSPDEKPLYPNEKKDIKVEIPPLNFEYTVAVDKQPQYFETKLNCFKNISDTTPHSISFKDLKKMQAKYADSVKQIRAEENGDRQKQMKSELLPCIAFNVRFNGNRCKDNICEYTKMMEERKISFSPAVAGEITEMQKVSNEAMEVLEKLGEYPEESMKKIEALEQQMDDMTENYRKAQIERMQTGKCSDEACILYSEMLTDFERIGDHILNIGQEIGLGNVSE